MPAPEDARQPTDDASWVGIVDDDPSLRVALARALRGHGIRAQTFESAEDFLHRSVGGAPECIVLDIHLGGMSGIELRNLLESRGTAPPIVFITGHDDMLQSAGVDRTCGLLRKPFDTSALLALVRPHLRGALIG